MLAFFMAWQMYLWIPCPVQKWDQTKRVNMLVALPFIGLVVGALWYGIWVLIHFFGSFNIIQTSIMAVFPWMITGFMHLDGFMDCADAALYFGTIEKKRAILKDSHCGSFAIVSMAILAVFEVAGAYQFFTKNINLKQALILIFIPIVSRAIAVLQLFSHEEMKGSSLEGINNEVSKAQIAKIWLILILVMGLIFLACGYKYFIAIIIGGLVEFLSSNYLIKNLGAMSGDIAGSAITTGELACLIALALV